MLNDNTDSHLFLSIMVCVYINILLTLCVKIFKIQINVV